MQWYSSAINALSDAGMIWDSAFAGMRKGGPGLWRSYMNSMGAPNINFATKALATSMPFGVLGIGLGVGFDTIKQNRLHERIDTISARTNAWVASHPYEAGRMTSGVMGYTP